MNPNSAMIWLPAIERAGLPIPRTEVVPYNPRDLFPTLDGLPYTESFPIADLRAACERIGFPVFLRTDLSSAKHRGKKAWKIESQHDVVHSVCLTFEDNELKWLGSQTGAFLVRELLPLKHDFTAFNGLPIARERRFFVSQESALCSHFYWPEDAFARERVLPQDWQLLLANLSVEPEPPEMKMLESLSLTAARAIGHDSWSVDWAQDVHGKWWLLDMAMAADSWHPHCQRASDTPDKGGKVNWLV